MNYMQSKPTLKTKNRNVINFKDFEPETEESELKEDLDESINDSQIHKIDISISNYNPDKPMSRKVLIRLLNKAIKERDVASLDQLEAIVDSIR